MKTKCGDAEAPALTIDAGLICTDPLRNCGIVVSTEQSEPIVRPKSAMRVRVYQCLLDLIERLAHIDVTARHKSPPTIA